MRLMVRNCLFFTCFAVFTSLFGMFLMHLDINKRAYNHVPGECGVIPNLPGILSLATTTGGRLYMTVNSRENSSTTHLFTFYSDNRTAREIEIEKHLKQKETRNSLKPGPMSATSDPENPTMFVFNERTRNVEVFETNEQSDTWKYQWTSRHGRYQRLTDLAASTKNTIYFVTSSFLGDSFVFKLFERILPIPSGQVFFANKIAVKQLMFISTPTAIVYDELRKTIFVTSFTRNSIYAIRVKNDYNVEKVTEHNIGCSPTSIWKDFDGSFVVTCQQVRFRYLLQLLEVTQSSPTLVLRVVISVDKEVTITQLYSNDGATISHATAAVRAGRSLLISEKENILNCHL